MTDIDKSTKFRGRWLLVRIDDDSNLIGLELDDFQASFSTRFDEQLSVIVGKISFVLTGRQASEVREWWKDPA